MKNVLKYEECILPGTYGDREVHLFHCIPEFPNDIQIVLLHGVHSSANVGVHNKFRYLGELLVERGFTPWLVETSRKVRNRQDFVESIANWIKRAFLGKTFAQEQEDVFIAIRKVMSLSQGKPLWLWGFSLGGIIAISAASGTIAPPKGTDKPAIDKIILSGTGLVAEKAVEDVMMTMPILSTLRSTLSPNMLANVRASGLISFRGSNDEIFSELSCREVVRTVNIANEAKHFHVISGGDHSMRFREGKPDPGIMKEMVDYIVETWC